MTEPNLVVQFKDDFGTACAPPDGFDQRRWTELTGTLRTERGYGLQEARRPPPHGPGDMTFALFCTRAKHFNRGLTGTNGAAVTLVNYIHEEDYPKELDNQIIRNHIMGWGLTIGSWRGQVGGQKDHQKDRGVQLHIDLMGESGLYVSLVRGIVPGDWHKYRIDGLFLESAVANGAITQPELESLEYDEWRLARTDELAKQGAFMSYPCLVVSCKIYRLDHEIHGRSNRYGVYLTDDGNALYWTLNNQVVDTFDITGYFSSSPESVQDGAFLTIGGAGCFSHNTWVLDDVEISVS